MPAIASIEDLRAAQEDGLSINAMLSAPCLPAVGTALWALRCVGVYEVRGDKIDF